MATLAAQGALAIPAPPLADARAERQALYLGLVADHAEGVARFLYGMVGDRTLAEDLAQDVFERAWSELSALRDPAAARSWLFAIAANTARRQLRRQGRFGWLPLDALHHEAARGVDDRLPDEALVLDAALSRLSLDDRTVLLLVGERDLTLDEVAQALAVSPEAAKKRWQRACARMRKAMSEP